MIDYWTLEYVASALLIVAFARTLTMWIRWEVWHMATYTLLGLIAAIGIILLSGANPKVEVFFAGVAVVVGLTWTGLASPHRSLSLKGQLASIAAAVTMSIVLSLLAMNYEWWTAPAIILGLILVAFARDFLVMPGIGWARQRKGLTRVRWGAGVPAVDVSAPNPPPRPIQASKVKLSAPRQNSTGAQVVNPFRPVPPRSPRGQPIDVAAAQVGPSQWRFACPKCGSIGRTGNLGTVLACPRCKTRVRPKRTSNRV